LLLKSIRVVESQRMSLGGREGDVWIAGHMCYRRTNPSTPVNVTSGLDVVSYAHITGIKAKPNVILWVV